MAIDRPNTVLRIWVLDTACAVVLWDNEFVMAAAAAHNEIRLRHHYHHRHHHIITSISSTTKDKSATCTGKLDRLTAALYKQ